MKLFSLIGKGLYAFGRGLGFAGRVTVAIVGIAGVGTAVADYTMTQGSGTTFASVVISTKHYASQLICDFTVGETACATIKPASTAPLATDTSLVVGINPNSVNPNGQAAMANSVSVAIANNQTPIPFLGFRPTAFGTPIAVTSSAVTGSLPAGSVVVATNVGTTNIAYCALGAVATTSAQPIAPNGGWFAFTISADTQLTCITSTSTTTVNMAGGSGIPTGTGGGSGAGGGGGGAITAASGSYAAGSISAGAYAAGAVVAGAFVDGWDATQGTKADAAWVSGSGSVIALLKNIAGGVAGSVPAGTNIVGKFGIDQTTPGTTNGVQLVAALPAGSNVVGGMTPVPGSLGSCTPYHLSGGTAASNNSTNIKNGNGTLCGLTPINTTATIYYLKMYDLATAPTCSSATGLKHVYPIPAGTSGNGFIISLPFGEQYASGIGFCVTGGGADTDNTNAATGVFVEASYK